MAELDFRALVEAAPDVIAVVDRDHRYLYANRAFVEATQRPLDWLLGKRNDEVVPAEAVAMWREAIDHVLATGEERWIERTIETPRGARRYSARLTRLLGDCVCIATRDVTELRAEKLLATAARTMPVGMLIVEAPSGQVVFRNAETLRIFGGDTALTAVRWDVRGHVVAFEAWPIARALRGETVAEEAYRIARGDGEYRTVRISASPVRDAHGAICAAVAAYRDVTDEQRAHETAAFLAEVGAELESFDDATGLQRIAELAVPRIADWAFIHLVVGDEVVSAAIGHADPDVLARARVLAREHRTLSADTAVARVLAGGPPELVTIDDSVLEKAARDAQHLAWLRAVGYRSSVVAPLVARGRVLGAMTLSITDSPRRFDDADLRMITELARRVGVALDNARLFRAERDARRRAEEAGERTRRLQELTAQLSGALEEADVVVRVVEAGRAAIGAVGGFAWLRRDADALELVAHTDASGASKIVDYRRIPLEAELPVCHVARTGQPLVFETLDAMLAAFPNMITPDETPHRAWAVIPFVANGHAIGAASFAFAVERTFSSEDREMLAAMTGQAALALDRCRLLADITKARRHERELHGLAAKLSSALVPVEIARTVAAEATRVLDAYVGSAMLRDGTEGARLARTGPLVDTRPDRLPLDMATPSTDAIRAGELVWCANVAEIRARYPHMESLRDANGFGSWGAVPFMVEGRVIGALAIAFQHPHVLRSDEREFLASAGQLAAQAIERARLYDELRDKDERLRAALFAGRAGTWSVDVRTMVSQRDPSYAALFELPEDVPVSADFAMIHPDDRDIARAAYERTMRDGVPYEPEIRLRKGDGSYVWTRSYGQLLHDERGPRLLAGLTFDIHDAKCASLELEKAYAAAREAHRRKDEFLAMLGHELRNPLAPISTALDLMAFKGAGLVQKERDVIRRQVEHLSRLIDDLLDVSRITRGKVQLARSIVELGTVLAKAIEMASPLLEKRSHRLTIDVPRDLFVDADPTRLAQVFHNLVMNAAKYTEAHGEIEVHARGTDEDICVQIRDNGIGISPELLPHLFDLFTQGQRSLDRADGGLGIGLTIARSLCELHGGSIAAESHGANRGSTFTVRLPRATRVATPVEPASAVAPQRVAKAARILVVDDNVDAAATLHEFLAQLGHEPAMAHDGLTALDLATKLRPDIAVLDIGLPVMDGYELARRLRAQLGNQIRLVAVTGYGQESDRTRALEAGFDHHVVKPIALDVLTALLDPPR